MGVRLWSSSNGMTGSAAHFSSTAKNTTKSPADVPNRPRMTGEVHLYAVTEVELVLSDTAIKAAPTHPARSMQPNQSIRRSSCAGLCFARGVAAPDVGSEGTA